VSDDANMAGRGAAENSVSNASGVAKPGADQEAAAMSRRDALKLFGAVPMVAALDWASADVARAADFVRSLTLSGRQYEPQFYTAEEWRTLNILVDYIIPRDDRSGSATDAKVPEFLDFMLVDPEQNISEGARSNARNHLAWFDTECRSRFGRPFATCSDAQRRAVLDDIAWPAKAAPEMSAGVAAFNYYRDRTGAGFFSSAMGWKDLDYRGSTAVPVWNGCPEPALQKLGVSYDLMNTRVPVQHGE
jgi:gluconate 2-dehydrogenase gamma chain